MTATFRQTSSGVELRIRLTPKAAVDHVDGVKAASDGSAHIAARVRAAPENGKANKALVQLTANWLGVPPSHVVLNAGATARIKTLVVSGDPSKLMERLERLIADNGDRSSSL